MRIIPSTLEALEARIAPAAVLDARTVSYTDTDGDLVKIVFSKAVFTGTATAQALLANQVLTFDTGTVDGAVTAHQQLQLLDFTKFSSNASTGSSVNGVGVTISATTAGGGNGTVDVGAVKATGVSLGPVSISGDLGQIDAGVANKTVGLAGLTVGSLGAKGVATQIPVASPTTSNPAPDLVSTITGQLTFLTVGHDVNSARVQVIHGVNSAGTVTALASIGPVTIGGSLLGRTAVESASDYTGEIDCQGAIGAVKIGTLATDGIVGGGGQSSGTIIAKGAITSVTVTGKIQGGGGLDSGEIHTENNLGPVKISGNLSGGAGERSGHLLVFGNLASLTVNGSIQAGTGVRSGVVDVLGTIATGSVGGNIDGSVPSNGSGTPLVPGVQAGGITAGNITSFTVMGSLLGGSANGTGHLESTVNMQSVTITHDVMGGAGTGSGALTAGGNIGSVLVKGNVLGGAGAGSGVLRSGVDYLGVGTFNSATVLGHITGGGGSSSGSIIAGGALGAVTVGSATQPLADVLTGGSAPYSGVISAHGLLGAVTLYGNIQGGSDLQTGAILAFDRTDSTGEHAGDLGTLKITGHLAGSSGSSSGAVLAYGNLTSLTVGAVTGGTGLGSGTVRTGLGVLHPGSAGTVKLNGDLAQAATSPGVNSASLLFGTSVTQVTVTGSLHHAIIRAGNVLSALTVTGDVADSVISARGLPLKSTSDVALGALTVNGNISNSTVLAGYNLLGAAVDPDASIGTVLVKGNWSATSLVAGAQAGSAAGYGQMTDTKAPGSDLSTLVSKIASVTIGGTAAGSSDGNQSFGIEAQTVLKVKVGTKVYALNSLADKQVLPIGAAGSNFVIREIPLI